jgi:hypothetical protein
MISICNTSYLDSSESRKFLGMTARNWQLYRFRMPFINHEGEDFWKLGDLQDIKDMIDPKRYINEARLVIELDTYWLKFRSAVDKLDLPRFKHPFHSRMLYRVSDKAVIRRSLNAKTEK